MSCHTFQLKFGIFHYKVPVCDCVSDGGMGWAATTAGSMCCGDCSMAWRCCCSLIWDSCKKLNVPCTDDTMSWKTNKNNVNFTCGLTAHYFAIITTLCTTQGTIQPFLDKRWQEDEKRAKIIPQIQANIVCHKTRQDTTPNDTKSNVNMLWF